MIKKYLRKIIRSEPINYIRSYSQEGEDMILRSMFQDRNKTGNGFYIDVGALHPFRFSNTAYFYEAGWRGINIEPTPNAIELFKKYRERDINLNIGIADRNDTLTFYCFDEPALNSFSKELSEERHQNTRYKITHTVNIPIYPLRKVLDEHLPNESRIDFMSIDVEGLDLQVLQSNNWEKYRPDFILAEDIIDFNKLSSSGIYCFLSEKGYELKAKTERTLVFCDRV